LFQYNFSEFELIEVILRFGMQFFPDVCEKAKPPKEYYSDAMRLIEYCDLYGYSHVRTVEHYFHYWGGYSPSPLMFLTAASQHTKLAKLITGAVVPAFNHPLKLASEIAMLDGISGGRLEVGFARAFLPQEFRHFEVEINESVERFEEGIAQVQKLLEEEDVTFQGRFHSFSGVTTYPRPTQNPRPPFYVAVVGTPASFERAGKMGHWIMAIPGVGSDPIGSMQIYRDAWREAGHATTPKILLAVFMYCHEDRDIAMRVAKLGVENHFEAIVDAMSEYTEGAPSDAYKNYDKIRDKIACQTLESQIESMAAVVGTPDDIVSQLLQLEDATGGCDEVSMQVLYGNMPFDDAERSVKLFGKEVIPRFQ
jgi:alkanesulfonate monooxygenase SsuD/methylene tetrahydromethanopterin reductase-like flavin-dependent oxidoreductase (luciferase family)